MHSARGLMDSEIERRVWEWLPARRDRRRTTQPSVIAANLGLSTSDVTHALNRMARGGHAFVSPRGSWHRGMPLTKPEHATTNQEELWD